MSTLVRQRQSGPDFVARDGFDQFDSRSSFWTPPRVDDQGYGFPVPCLVISPYARPGHVSHDTYDHACVAGNGWGGAWACA